MDQTLPSGIIQHLKRFDFLFHQIDQIHAARSSLKFEMQQNKVCNLYLIYGM